MPGISIYGSAAVFFDSFRALITSQEKRPAAASSCDHRIAPSRRPATIEVTLWTMRKASSRPEDRLECGQSRAAVFTVKNELTEAFAYSQSV